MRKHKFLLLLLPACIFLTFGRQANAQTPSRWKAHDMNRPRPPVVKPAAQALPMPPPSDAIVLFDGKDLSEWRRQDGGPAKWAVVNGYTESTKGSGYIYTRRTFGDMQLHVEWAAPLPAEGKGQGRGNSGVYLMGLYEIQVLDSYDNDTYPDGQAAAVYGQYPPLVNVCRPPGEWQSYDIFFRRPHFNPDGLLLEPGRVTVLHNGVLVQDNVKFWGFTNWLQHIPYEAHPDRLPISLQDHGNPVRYRNIWLRELPEQSEPGPANLKGEPIIVLQPEELDRYVGKYRAAPNGDIFAIYREGQKLVANFSNPAKIELVPHSTRRFSLRWTAATVTFDLGANNIPRSFTLEIGGDQRVATRVE